MTGPIRGICVSLALAAAVTLLSPPGASAVGPGKQCGGFPGIPCDAGLFCQNPPGTCGVIDVGGRCVKVRRVCGRIYRPVCGCDGKTYGNDCERQMAMVSKNHNGACRTPKM